MSGKLSRRLFVTGHDANGRSRLASSRVVTGDDIPNAPGAAISRMWGNDDLMHYPDAGEAPSTATVFPPLHGTRLVEILLPAGDAATHLEDGPSRMHRTETMDYIIVMEGRCDCQLDDGTVTLNSGDVLVQSGAIHAWFNPYDAPCRFLAVLVGAKNDLCA